MFERKGEGTIITVYRRKKPTFLSTDGSYIPNIIESNEMRRETSFMLLVYNKKQVLKKPVHCEVSRIAETTMWICCNPLGLHNIVLHRCWVLSVDDCCPK